jgi:hypothetical protein
MNASISWPATANRYRTLVSIVSALDSLAGVAVIYLLGTDGSGPPGGAGPGTLSPAYFLGGDAHPALRAALENVTVFSVWGYALLALGIALTTRLTRGQSILVAGVVWGMQTAFLVGLALIFSRFGIRCSTAEAQARSLACSRTPAWTTRGTLNDTP